MQTLGASTPLRIGSRFPKLCVHCQEISWPSHSDQRLPPDQRLIPHYGTFTSLQESADQGCELCQFFWFFIVNDVRITARIQELLLLENKLIIRFHDLTFLFGSLILVVSLENSDKSLNLAYEINIKRCEPSRTEWLHTVGKRQVKSFADPELLHVELKELIGATIQPWIENCQNHKTSHKRCDSLSVTKNLPKRLIDVSELQNSDPEKDCVRLIEQPDRGEYLILSYCWGKGNATARTTRGNISHRLVGFFTARLPKTIQDAIQVTRLLDICYLWVDAICIIQSSGQHDPGDFEEEAVKMMDYYANAKCCIAASSAKDSSEGFLRPRLNTRYHIQHISISITCPRKAQAVTYELDPDSALGYGAPFEILSRSPLMRRGWYLQELLLSRRTLHWTRFGLIYECPSCWCLEGCTESWNNEGPADYRFQYPTIPRDDNMNIAQWYRLLRFFSGMRLTFPKDRLYGIHGLASLFSRQLDSENIYGMFLCSIASGLAWEYVPPHNIGRHWEIEDEEPRQSQYPTWCWASNGRVYFAELDPALCYTHMDTNLQALHHNIRFHPGVLGYPYHQKLFLKAPLIWVQKQEAHRASIQDLRRGCKIVKRCGYTPDNHFGDISGCQNDWEAGRPAQWLLLGMDPLKKKYVGLLVKEANDEEKGVYRRYAYMYVEQDEFRLKPGSIEIYAAEDLYKDVSDIVLV